MKPFQVFWVLFKTLLEIIWNIIKILYTVRYLNIITISATVIGVIMIVYGIVKRAIRRSWWLIIKRKQMILKEEKNE